jgi:SAM-dependent MidA family methyltransferase
MPRDILPEPPDDLKRHSDRLSARILEAVETRGYLSFEQYMEMALYEPGLGYYSAGLHKLGKSGDFVTAPEIGSLFAACLARQCAETGEELGAYDVLEVGAGTGRLAADLLGQVDPDRAPVRYRILERSADLQHVQQRRIRDEAPGWADRVEWLQGPPDEDWQGVLIANEVIDALSAECFEIRDGVVHQLCVANSGEGFGWSSRPAPAGLEAAVRHLEEDTGRVFAPGYRSEIRPRLAAWLDALTAKLARGLALFIDYGYPRSEYYLPERSAGTLMCHYRHRAHDDPFFMPGLQDITAWVDFTALAEAADACGLAVDGYTSQAMFLLGCGLDRVLSERLADAGDGGLALNAEARQLTLPGMMGEKFQVMGLGRGLRREPAAFSLRDLRYRL